ncbi:MAG: hypothetical protein M3Z31_15500 [Pseudomonadota bacterium]|nr:hypothetical protein [Pseudomonadota bacterium]
MKRYPQQSTVSIMGALGAALATAVTIGIAVLVPAKLSPVNDSVVSAAAHTTEAAPIEVVIAPSRIEVIGYRTDHTAAVGAGVEGVQARAATAGRKS